MKSKMPIMIDHKLLKELKASPVDLMKKDIEALHTCCNRYFEATTKDVLRGYVLPADCGCAHKRIAKLRYKNSNNQNPKGVISIAARTPLYDKSDHDVGMVAVTTDGKAILDRLYPSIHNDCATDLAEALKFYADHKNWYEHPKNFLCGAYRNVLFFDSSPDNFRDVPKENGVGDYVAGKRARAVLIKYGFMEGEI